MCVISVGVAAAWRLHARRAEKILAESDAGASTRAVSLSHQAEPGNALVLISHRPA